MSIELSYEPLRLQVMREIHQRLNQSLLIPCFHNKPYMNHGFLIKIAIPYSQAETTEAVLI